MRCIDFPPVLAPLVLVQTTQQCLNGDHRMREGVSVSYAEAGAICSSKARNICRPELHARPASRTTACSFNSGFGSSCNLQGEQSSGVFVLDEIMSSAKNLRGTSLELCHFPEGRCASKTYANGASHTEDMAGVELS